MLLAVLLAGLLAGCSGSDDDRAEPRTGPSPPSPRRPRPRRRPQPAPRPEVKACYRLAYDEAVAPTSRRKPVPCEREHTATTFHVGTLDAVVDGHLLAVDSRPVQDAGRHRVPDAGSATSSAARSRSAG